MGKASFFEKHKRHREYIHEQLGNLYGRLFFLSSLNEGLITNAKKIYSSAKKHFEGNELSDSAETRESTGKGIIASIELANEYMNKVVENNEEIFDLLKNNYSLIDVNDIDVLRDFVIDFIRMHKEVKEARLKEIPRIKSKFLSKKSVLKRLSLESESQVVYGK